MKRKKKKKVILNESERRLLKASAKAHKEILSYLKEKELNENIKVLLEDPIHMPFLKPRTDIIKSARAIALNKRYERMVDSVKVHHKSTSKGGSNTTQWRIRKDNEAKRALEVIEYPDGLTKEEKEAYRILFKKHFNSGMSKEQAQKLTLKGLVKLNLQIKK